MFTSYTKFYNKSCQRLGLAILDFLTESVLGPCYGNQVEMIQAKIVESCDYFLKDLGQSAVSHSIKGFSIFDQEYTHSSHQSINDLFYKTIYFLSALQENMTD